MLSDLLVDWCGTGCRSRTIGRLASGASAAPAARGARPCAISLHHRSPASFLHPSACCAHCPACARARATAGAGTPDRSRRRPGPGPGPHPHPHPHPHLRAVPRARASRPGERTPPGRSGRGDQRPAPAGGGALAGKNPPIRTPPLGCSARHCQRVSCLTTTRKTSCRESSSKQELHDAGRPGRLALALARRGGHTVPPLARRGRREFKSSPRTV
jgi:hypothetical protein